MSGRGSRHLLSTPVREEVKSTMTTMEICGTIEQRPRVFEERPYYSTVSLRTDSGALIEVFLLTAAVGSDQAGYCTGRRLTLTGGEQQVAPGVDGQKDCIRYWPDTVRVEQEPAYLF